jgi:heavy metal translocating P-type ATPase
MPELRWAALATVLFAVGGVVQAAGAPRWAWWAPYLACYASGGWEPGLAGLRALRARTLDVDLLMIVAAVVAASIGQVLDGALLIVIFATSGALEALATKRTADSVNALLSTHDGEELVDTADLIVGDVILVRPGELIGADATVIEGTSEVDQASITGEPLPVVKEPGDEVYAGTVNSNGALRLRVTRAASESVVARIVALVEEASATKANAQLFIDKIEQRYSVGMVIATLALFVIPITTGAAAQPTLLRAMTFMIVASPCAVVLATMPPLLSAIANSGRHGVLVKSAVVMEQFALTDVVAFDKTGTLTDGRPRVADITPLVGSGWEPDTLLAVAASAERDSEHPIAVAIVAAARDRGLNLEPAMQFQSTPGRGVHATVNGQRVRIGSPAILNHAPAGDPRLPEIETTVSAAESAGRTAVVILIDNHPTGVVTLTDQIRPGAAAATARLARLTGNPLVLMTGDNLGAAHQLATEVGITDVHASLLPEAKVTRVKAIQEAGHRVLLVGDGVNDAPALATADLGLAMGRHGSDLALETADAVLVRDDLSSLPRVLDLSRQARRVVTANLAIAATVISGLVIWDLAGHLPLPLGVAGHEGSTVIVGLNGLRLLRKSAWQNAGQ